jgi:hypothetical protein
MSVRNSYRWLHVVLVTMIASVFAAVPFVMPGLGTDIAELAAMIIVPSNVAAYLFVRKVSSSSMYEAHRQVSASR